MAHGAVGQSTEEERFLSEKVCVPLLPGLHRLVYSSALSWETERRETPRSHWRLYSLHLKSMVVLGWKGMLPFCMINDQ